MARLQVTAYKKGKDGTRLFAGSKIYRYGGGEGSRSSSRSASADRIHTIGLSQDHIRRGYVFFDGQIMQRHKAESQLQKEIEQAKGSASASIDRRGEILTVKKDRAGQVTRVYEPKLFSGSPISRIITTSKTAHTPYKSGRTTLAKNINKARLSERGQIEKMMGKGTATEKVLRSIKGKELTREQVLQRVQMTTKEDLTKSKIAQDFLRPHNRQPAKELYKIDYRTDAPIQYTPDPEDYGMTIGGASEQKYSIRQDTEADRQIAQMLNRTYHDAPKTKTKKTAYTPKYTGAEYGTLGLLPPAGIRPVKDPTTEAYKIGLQVSKKIDSEMRQNGNGTIRQGREFGTLGLLPPAKHVTIPYGAPLTTSYEFLAPKNTPELALMYLLGKGVQKGGQKLLSKIPSVVFKTTKKGAPISIERIKTPVKITKMIGTSQRVSNAETNEFIEKTLIRFAGRHGKKKITGEAVQSTIGKKTPKGFEKYVVKSRASLDTGAESILEGAGRSTPNYLKTISEETLGGKKSTVGYFARTKKSVTRAFPQGSKQVGVSYDISRKGQNKAVLRIKGVGASKGGLIAEEGEGSVLRQTFRLESGTVSTQSRSKILNEFVGRNHSHKIRGLPKKRRIPTIRGKRGSAQLLHPETELKIPRPGRSKSDGGFYLDRAGSQNQIERLLGSVRPTRNLPRNIPRITGILGSNAISGNRIDPIAGMGLHNDPTSRINNAIRSATGSKTRTATRNKQIQRSRNETQSRQRQRVTQEQYLQRIQHTISAHSGRGSPTPLPKFYNNPPPTFKIPYLLGKSAGKHRRNRLGYEERLYRIQKYRL